MNEAERALSSLLKDLTPKPPRLIDPAAVTAGRFSGRPVRSAHLRRWAAPITAAAVVVLLAVGLLTVIQRAHKGSAPSAGQRTVISTFDGLSLPHPASWTEMAARPTPFAAFSPLGYLSAQVGRQCLYPLPAVGPCDPPVTSLPADGIFITVESVGLLGSFAANATVAGSPTQLSAGSASSRPGTCPDGSGTYASAVIKVSDSRGHQPLTVIGCFGAASDGQSAFAAMLKAATYRRPT
jgi:hypothetical protein